MLKNHLLLALRQLRRNRGHALISIAGLAVGIACFLLIARYVQDEREFDRFHERAHRTYRVLETRSTTGRGRERYATTAGPLGPHLVDQVPSVASSVRFFRTFRIAVRRGDRLFYEGEYFFTEPTFFDVFDFPLIAGSESTSLSQPGGAVLTESTAERYFGDSNPLGKTLSVEGFGEVTVTGILADPPQNSHLDFSMLLPFATLEQVVEEWETFVSNWTPDSRAFITYAVVAEDGSAGAVEASLAAVRAEHFAGGSGHVEEITLQPLTDIHFQSADIQGGVNHSPGEVRYVYVFAAIAAIVLLLACINYTNLAMAQSTMRVREVGMRRVVGAGPAQVARQFLVESSLVAGVAFLLGLGLARIALPAFNRITGKELALVTGNGGTSLAIFIALVLLVGIASGGYPAFFLSRLQPANVMRGAGSASGGLMSLRKALIVFQFTASIVLLTATLVVHRQMEYVQQKRLGYNQAHLVAVDINSGNVRSQSEAVKSEFRRVPGVRSVTTSSRLPGDWKGVPQFPAAPDGRSDAVTTVSFIGADADFLDTYQIGLLKGRNFSGARAADSSAVLINEAAATHFGWSDPIGRTIRFPEEDFHVTVIGVVEDFHFRSLHERVGPLVLGSRENQLHAIDYFTVRIDAQNVPATIQALRAVGERFDPEHPFEYNFLEARLADYYESEERVGRLVGIASALAVSIACLGLFGLAAFMTQRRRKEVAVRKVLGASIVSVAGLLTRDFLALVVLAFVLAVPLAYLGMARWLEGFAYRADLDPIVFLLAGGLAGAVAVLTVGYQTVKVAAADPVGALRYE